MQITDTDIGDSDQVLILGGGFAGLFAALHLSSSNCPLAINIIDRETHFVFKPLLYELLSDEVETDVVWPRYDDLLSGRDVTFTQGTVQSIDLQNQRVELESGQRLQYRFLVIALGDSVGYFGVPGAEEFTFTFRTAQDAFDLSKHLRQTLQQALQTDDDERRRALLTTAIVGAGASGVELSATLADLLPAWYEEIGGNGEDIRIVLLQRGSTILDGNISNSIRDAAKISLSKRNTPVELQLNATVTEITADSLVYRRDDQSCSLLADTVVWTAGSATHPVIQSLPIADVHQDDRGRPYLTSALQVIDFPNVFAGGDCAVNVHEPMPADAQVAYQQGRAIAHNIMALIEGRDPEPSDITIRGTLLKLGIEESIAEIFGKVDVSGRIGHLIRRATYLSLLPTPARNLRIGAEWIADEVLDPFLNV